MQSRTRIKICGVTRLDDALAIARLGADSIGLVFHAQSPRFIKLELARNIRHAMPPFVTITALFMNEDEGWINEVIAAVNPDCLQFHGEEDETVCTQWQKPYLKTVPMGSTIDVDAYAKRYLSAQGFLFDSNEAGRQGGSGDTFDWSKIPPSFDRPFILAGGLNPVNVSDAVSRMRPWGVDVSSGVEKSKGVKDIILVNQFFHEVKRGDSNA